VEADEARLASQWIVEEDWALEGKVGDLHFGVGKEERKDR
jgi:hypothetical protein